MNHIPESLNESMLNYNDVYDRIFTYLVMMDYDWMNYHIQAEVPLKDGIMKLDFEYIGCTKCDLKIQYNNDSIIYEFDSDLYDEFLKKYLKAEMDAVDATYAFYGGDIVMEFYNKVMDSYKSINLERSAEIKICSVG